MYLTHQRHHNVQLNGQTVPPENMRAFRRLGTGTTPWECEGRTHPQANDKRNPLTLSNVMAKETDDKDHLVNSSKDMEAMPSEEIDVPSSQTEKVSDDDVSLSSQNSTANNEAIEEPEQSQLLVDALPSIKDVPSSAISSASNSVITVESNLSETQDAEYGYDDDVPFSYYSPLQTKERTAPLIDHQKSKAEKKKEKKERKKVIKILRQEVQQHRLLEQQEKDQHKKELESILKNPEPTETGSKLSKPEPTETESKSKKPEPTEKESKVPKHEDTVHDYNLATTMAGLAMSVSDPFSANPNFLYDDGEIDQGDNDDDDDDDEEFSVEALESIKIAKSKRVSMRLSINQKQSKTKDSKKKSSSSSSSSSSGGAKKKSKKKRGRRADYEESEEGDNRDTKEVENDGNPPAQSTKDVAARVEAIFTNKDLIMKEFDGYIEKMDVEKKQLEKMLEEQHRGRGLSVSNKKHRGRSRSSSKPKFGRSHSTGATGARGRSLLKRGRRPENREKAKQSLNEPGSTSRRPPDNRRSSLMAGRSKSEFMVKHMKKETRQNRKKRAQDAPEVKSGQLTLDDGIERPLSEVQKDRKRSGSFSELEDRIHADKPSADLNKTGISRSSKKSRERKEKPGELTLDDGIERPLSESQKDRKRSGSFSELEDQLHTGKPPADLNKTGTSRSLKKSRERKEKPDQLTMDDGIERPVSESQKPRRQSGSFSELEDQLHTGKPSADINKTGTSRSLKKSRERKEKPDQLTMDDRIERPLSESQKARRQSGSFSELEDQLHTGKPSADPIKTGTSRSSKTAPQSPSEEVAGSNNEKTKAKPTAKKGKKGKTDTLTVDDSVERPLSISKGMRRQSSSYSDFEVRKTADEASTLNHSSKNEKMRLSSKTLLALSEEVTTKPNSKKKSSKKGKKEQQEEALTLNDSVERPSSVSKALRRQSSSYSQLEGAKASNASLSRLSDVDPTNFKASSSLPKENKKMRLSSQTLLALSEEVTAKPNSKKKSSKKGKKEQQQEAQTLDDSAERPLSVSKALRRRSSYSQLEGSKASNASLSRLSDVDPTNFKASSSLPKENEKMRLSSKTLLALSEEVTTKPNSKKKSSKKGKKEQQQEALTLNDSVERPLSVSKGLRRQSSSYSQLEGAKASNASLSRLSDVDPTNFKASSSLPKENRQKYDTGLPASEHGTSKKKGSTSKEVSKDPDDEKSMEGLSTPQQETGKKKRSKSKEPSKEPDDEKSVEGLSTSEHGTTKKKGSKSKEPSKEPDDEKSVEGLSTSEHGTTKKKGSKSNEASKDPDDEKSVEGLSTSEHGTTKKKGSKKKGSKSKEGSNDPDDDEKSFRDYEIPLAPPAPTRPKERASLPDWSSTSQVRTNDDDDDDGSPSQMESKAAMPTNLVRSASLGMEHETMKRKTKESPSGRVGRKKTSTKGTERTRSKSPKKKGKSPLRKSKSGELLEGTSTHSVKEKKKPKRSKSGELDDLLGGTSTHSVKEKKKPKRSKSGELDDLLGGTSTHSVKAKKNPSRSKSGELDDLLGGTSTHSVKEKKKPKRSKSGELDDLLGGTSTHSVKEKKKPSSLKSLEGSTHSVKESKRRSSLKSGDLSGGSSHSVKETKRRSSLKSGELSGGSSHSVKETKRRSSLKSGELSGGSTHSTKEKKKPSSLKSGDLLGSPTRSPSVRDKKRRKAGKRSSGSGRRREEVDASVTMDLLANLLGDSDIESDEESYSTKPASFMSNKSSTTKRESDAKSPPADDEDDLEISKPSSLRRSNTGTPNIPNPDPPTSPRLRKPRKSSEPRKPGLSATMH